MLWINEHKRIWRTAFLLLLIVAIIGPWVFDHIFVPAEYICSLPSIRLDENFCGIPRPLMSLLPFIIGDFESMAISLVTGTMDPMSLILASFLLLPMLPLLSTTLLILRDHHRRWHIFQMIVLAMAAGIGLFFGLFGSWLHPALWGVWLYIALAVSGLLLERLAFVADRKFVQVADPSG